MRAGYRHLWGAPALRAGLCPHQSETPAAALGALVRDRAGSYRSGWLLAAVQPDELALAGAGPSVPREHSLAARVDRRAVRVHDRLVRLSQYRGIDAGNAPILHQEVCGGQGRPVTEIRFPACQSTSRTACVSIASTCSRAM